MLTEKMSQFGARVGILAVPSELRDLPVSPLVDLRDRCSALAFCWGMAASVAAVLMPALGIASQLLTGNAPRSLIYVVAVPCVFAVTGVVIEGLRSEIGSIAVMVIPVENRLRPEQIAPALRWLVTPRDADVVAQVVITTLIAIAMFRSLG